MELESRPCLPDVGALPWLSVKIWGLAKWESVVFYSSESWCNGPDLRFFARYSRSKIMYSIYSNIILTNTVKKIEAAPSKNVGKNLRNF